MQHNQGQAGGLRGERPSQNAVAAGRRDGLPTALSACGDATWRLRRRGLHPMVGDATNAHSRRRQPALHWGELELRDAPGPVLSLVRSLDGERVLAMFKLGEETVVTAAPEGRLQLLDRRGLTGAVLTDDRLTLPAHALVFAQI